MGTHIKTEFSTAVAGVSHYQDIVSSVRIGEYVDVRAEPDNPYDSHALGLYVRGNKVGFVPAAVAQRVDKSVNWVGEVREVLHGPGITGLRVRLSPAGKVAGAPETPNPENLARQRPAVEADATERSKTMTAVYARSGRHLGSLIEADATNAHVENGGRVVVYPLDLVNIGRSS